MNELLSVLSLEVRAAGDGFEERAIYKTLNDTCSRHRRGRI